MTNDLNSDVEYMKYKLNPPIIIGEELAKVVTGISFNGTALPIKTDNRYKDGNVRIVKGVVRGNSKTVRISRLGGSDVQTN